MVVRPCAAWCDSCRKLRAVCEAVAPADPPTSYVRLVAQVLRRSVR
jgi:hypothetical protein